MVNAHAHHRMSGTEHLYPRPFQVVSDSVKRASVLRYVERNAVRAELVERGEDWRWSGTWRRKYGDAESRAILADWPIERPRN